MNSFKEGELSEVVVIGFNHKTTPVEIREKFAIEQEKVLDFLNQASLGGAEEIAYIATCNRVEVFFTSTDLHKSLITIVNLLQDFSDVKKEKFMEFMYKKQGEDTVSHLFSVVSGLDSMVLGENEILNQVKKAYRFAVSNKTTGVILNRLFHQAFNSAKRVKTETALSKSSLSIASIATEQAKKIVKSFSDKSALLIGAGEMGELILKSLTKCNIKEITIANRSLHNAEKIAEMINSKANIIPLDEIENLAVSVDILISSVTSKKYIIDYDKALELSKKRGKSPLIIIDIAVPRNIDPKIESIDNIYVYNVDSLEKIANENLQNRKDEVDLAKKIVQEDKDEYFNWYKTLKIVPTIMRLQETFDYSRKNELNKYRRRKLKHLSNEDFAIIDELTSKIMNKTLHQPIIALKSEAGYHSKNVAAEKTKIIEEIFKK